MAEPKKVIFIDDDPAYQRLVRRVCSKIPEVGEIIEAMDGAQALAIVEQAACGRREMPDVAFVDVNMPVLDGFGFLERLRELTVEYPSIATIRPLVMMSSSDEERDKERASRLGAGDFVVKPGSLAEIEESIRRVLA